ncbi:MAG: hypothetical protein HKO80_01045 [Flavobacteriaceae bacterium]|nr:hypothetical protein [Flavobacteriaceae bacterium]
MQNFISYIPIATTLFSVFFISEIFKHYLQRKTSYLLWWTLGVLTFGLGTLSESYHALMGWNGANLKFWYIVGALLGGFPLAQGSVYLLMPRWFAHLTTVFFVGLIIVASYFVIQSPFLIPEDYDFRMTGAVFEWKWVRQFSPLINIYSFLFLVGGAIYSAIKYYGQKEKKVHFRGNIFIALGALLPGIGGSFTRAGYVEVLFVTEFLGLVLIYWGYRIIKTSNIKTRIISVIN